MSENKVYKYDDLSQLTSGQLKEIRKEKQEELFQVRQEQNVIISNILQLQELIKNEIK